MSPIPPALVDLLWWETDLELRAVYQETLRGVWQADNHRALDHRQNAWYDLSGTPSRTTARPATAPPTRP